MRFIELLTFLSIPLAAPLLQVEQGATVVPGLYIIKFKHDETAVSESAVQVLMQSLSAAPKFSYSLSGFHGFAGTLSDAELARLQASEHPDVRMQAFDTVYQPSTLWGLSRISSKLSGNDTYVFDDSAGQDICAYTIDTGIFVDHPELERRATHLANFSEEEGDEDGEGHRTHVAGTIGSLTFGVAKKTQLSAVKVLDSYGSGTTSGIISGIDFVAKDAKTRNCPKGAVANLSLGGRKNLPTNQAAAAAVASGVSMAVATGNDGADAKYTSPASEPTVCTVGANAKNDSMPYWSNWGSLVDVFAPGVNITSLDNMGGTTDHSGTSMATPHVTGLAAYLLALQGGTTKGLCERIARLGLNGVVKSVPKGTPNVLANNCALAGYPIRRAAS
ncbi:hypothetical protein E8E11_009390 [Didymella keratinophila]|nr:hypothetical protein E8E11_009390 [Didymella keratinophila]